MLRTIRLTTAFICFTLVTLLFLDFTGTLHTWFGWLAKIQFLPAVLALNLGVVLLLIALTWIFGRVYCSVICPLGIFQDVVSWLAGKRKKNRFRYSPALSWLRYGVMVIFILAMISGLGAWAALIAPYSAYGRIASNLFVPLWQWGNNFLAYLAERAGSYAFYETEVWLRSLPTFIIATVTFIILIILAWRNGRTYCNTICPVGTFLGLISRFSVFKPVIDTSKCNGCGLCARNCKAACINAKVHEIDYSRCVDCMDCIDKCRQGAIRYTRRKTNKAETQTNQPVVDKPDRRKFFTVSALLATSAALKAQEKVQLPDKKVDGGLAIIEDKKKPDRTTPIPSGFAERCQFLPALHRVPALCIGLYEPCAASFGEPSNIYAARSIVRARILSSRMRQMFGSLPDRSDPSNHESRQNGHPDRTCRTDSGKLHRQPGWCHLRQLCPPLPYPGDLDGGKRPERPGFASTAGHKRGKMHRLRSL